mmetsp:Transcript_11831/g.28697  ORF Transcript_11831/g.28697 Transcript_11831/m.28697 type:complete len:223 (-) Transcript_11831:233-901(-)
MPVAGEKNARVLPPDAENPPFRFTGFDTSMDSVFRSDLSDPPGAMDVWRMSIRSSHAFERLPSATDDTSSCPAMNCFDSITGPDPPDEYENSVLSGCSGPWAAAMSMEQRDRAGCPAAPCVVLGRFRSRDARLIGRCRGWFHKVPPTSDPLRSNRAAAAVPGANNKARTPSEVPGPGSPASDASSNNLLSCSEGVSNESDRVKLRLDILADLGSCEAFSLPL